MEKKEKNNLVNNLFIEKIAVDNGENAERKYFNYVVKGKVRGRDVNAYLTPKDKGGYLCLDIVFGDSDKASLVVRPLSITQDNGNVVTIQQYFAENTTSDGETFSCEVKPFKGSDRTLINFLLSQLSKGGDSI